MADLSVASERVAEYYATVDYDVTRDSAKAIRFAAACRAILATPSSSSRDGQQYSFDLLRIENQLNQALSYIRANETLTDAQRLANPSVLHADFSTFGPYSSGDTSG